MRETVLFLLTLFVLLVSFLSSTPTMPTGYAVSGSDSLSYDVNLDGLVDGGDVSAVEKVLAGWESHYELTDVDGNGKTTAADLILLQAYLEG